MKIIGFVLALVMLLPAASCVEKNSSIEPSLEVITSFNTHFGKEFKVKWELTGQESYQASFRRNGHPVKACFDRSGNWLTTETELLSSEIPPVVISTIVAAFQGSAINKAFQVEKSSLETVYRISLKRGRQLSTVELTSGGVIISEPMLR